VSIVPTRRDLDTAKLIEQQLAHDAELYARIRELERRLAAADRLLAHIRGEVEWESKFCADTTSVPRMTRLLVAIDAHRRTVNSDDQQQSGVSQNGRIAGDSNGVEPQPDAPNSGEKP